MLSAEQNERLTQVEAGTPMGELLRRYWHPIAASAQLRKKQVMGVRLLGENMVLFVDRAGGLGLVGERCPHRRVKLEHGYVVEEGLRCPYHGWTFDREGRCTATPAEREGSSLKERISIKSWPVQELGGLVFAYLGPQPAPLLPRWEPLVMPNTLREIHISPVLCNWFQVHENSADMHHVEWLHGHFAKDYMDRKGYDQADPIYQNMLPWTDHIAEFRCDRYENGLLRRYYTEGGSREDPLWSVGQPIILPNIAVVSQTGMISFIWRVPVDRTNTLLMTIRAFCPGEGVEVPPQKEIPYVDISLLERDAQGDWLLDSNNRQDHLVFVAQEAITDRTQEYLAESDQGVVVFRRMMFEQIACVERGEEPINVFRDPASNSCIPVPFLRAGAEYLVNTDSGNYRRGAATQPLAGRHGELIDQMEDLAEKAAQVRQARIREAQASRS